MLCQKWWLAETVSNCLSTPACQSCPSLIPAPPPLPPPTPPLVLLLRLLIIFSLNCGGQTTFQWWSCHFGAFARKNILPREEHTQPADMCSCFFGRGRGGEKIRGALVLPFVLWYCYRLKTMSFSCHNSLKSKLTRTWHHENSDEIHSKRMDTCTYSLMCALEMKTIERTWR